METRGAHCSLAQVAAMAPDVSEGLFTMATYHLWLDDALDALPFAEERKAYAREALLWPCQRPGTHSIATELQAEGKLCIRTYSNRPRRLPP